jgi:hypothetical protein
MIKLRTWKHQTRKELEVQTCMETKEKGDERNNPRNNNDGNFSLSSGANNCKGKRGERKRSPMRMSCRSVQLHAQPCSHAASSLHQSASHAVHTHALHKRSIHHPNKQKKRER